MRRRAKHRLMGAVVLVVVAVIGFPLLFDTQPRPVSVDVPINIPDRNKTRPQVMPPAASSSAPALALTPPAAVANQAAPVASLDAKEEVIPARPAAAEAKAATVKTEKADTSPSPKAETRSAARTDDGSRARALLEGKDQPLVAPADTGRFIVQVGAFADAAKAREVRQKVEGAGLKTYTQVVETADGQRTRVRVGPYTSRAEADKAAGKIRQLDLPVAVLTL